MKRKKLLIVSAIVLVLAGGGAASYFYYFRHVLHPKASTSATATHLFASIAPMVVNVHAQSGQFGLGGSSDGYLQVGFKLETDSKKVVDAFEQLRPAVRGNVLTLMLKVSPDVLTKASARAALKNRILANVNRTLQKDAPGIGKQRFRRIYFTRFVTQSS